MVEGGKAGLEYFLVEREGRGGEVVLVRIEWFVAFLKCSGTWRRWVDNKWYEQVYRHFALSILHLLCRLFLLFWVD